MAQDTVPDTGRIVQDPAILVGKPTVKGTRISVELVLGHLSGNLDLDDLFEAYPRLTVEDVKAVLAFARDSADRDYRRSRRGAASAVTANA